MSVIKRDLMLSLMYERIRVLVQKQAKLPKPAANLLTTQILKILMDTSEEFANEIRKTKRVRSASRDDARYTRKEK